MSHYKYLFVRCFDRERDATIAEYTEAGWRLVQVVEYGQTILFLFEREVQS